MSPFKRYRDVAIVIVLLAVPFFFLRANMKTPENLNALDRVVLRISAPDRVRGVEPRARRLEPLGRLRLSGRREGGQRAPRLRERAPPRAASTASSRSETENRELRRLLQLRESLPGDTVSAQVIGKDFTEFFRVTRVVLDRGSRNIRPHMPVISPGRRRRRGAARRGRRGRRAARRSTRRSASTSRTSARTRAASCAAPAIPSRYACKVENVDSRDEVEIGDLLVTSGKGKWFPKGLPVARVTKVVKRELGPRPGGRSHAHRELLAPRRGAHPRHAARRRGRRPRRRRRPPTRSTEAPSAEHRVLHRRRSLAARAVEPLSLIRRSSSRVGWIVRQSRPHVPGLVPSLVLPLILFMGVHEYSLVARRRASRSCSAT